MAGRYVRIIYRLKPVMLVRCSVQETDQATNRGGTWLSVPKVVQPYKYELFTKPGTSSDADNCQFLEAEEHETHLAFKLFKVQTQIDLLATLKRWGSTLKNQAWKLQGRSHSGFNFANIQVNPKARVLSHLRAVLLDLGSKDTGLALSGSIDHRPEFQRKPESF